MPLVQTESIVLRTYSLAEADRIVVFFTRGHGIVRGVAKGAKRLNSRFGGSLEPFSLVNVEYFEKEDRELVSIRSIEIERSLFDIAAEPAFLLVFSEMADLLMAFVPPQDPNETLFRMVKACVTADIRSERELNALKVYFELWLLRLGGFLPDWSACYRCGRKFESTETARTDSDQHLLCSSCSRSDAGRAVVPAVRDGFVIARSLSPEDYSKQIGASDNDIAVKELNEILKKIIQNVIGGGRERFTAGL
ncbi:MAG: DNA repair protein RecO [Acidobacteria bacterium]|nr:DNA repair protein RecO [Acidobacteriota bacterium]